MANELINDIDKELNMLDANAEVKQDVKPEEEDLVWETVDVKPEEDLVWEEVNVPSYTTVDADSGEVYSVPASMDATDTRFAINTQDKGMDKGLFFGKEPIVEPKKSGLFGGKDFNKGMWDKAKEYQDRSWEDVKKDLSETGKTVGQQATKMGKEIVQAPKSLAAGAVDISGSIYRGLLDNMMGYYDIAEAAEKGYNDNTNDIPRLGLADLFLPRDLIEANALANRTSMAAKDNPELVEQVKETNRKAKELADEWRNDNKKKIEGISHSLLPEEKRGKWDFQNLMYGIGNGVTSIGGAAALTMTTKNPTIASAIIAKLFFDSSKSEAFQEAKERGESFDEADFHSDVLGGIDAASEYAGNFLLMGIGKFGKGGFGKKASKAIAGSIEKILNNKTVKEPVKKAIKNVARHSSVFVQGAKGFASEGFEEGLPTWLSEEYKNYIGWQDRSEGDIFKDSLWATFIGGVTGAGTASFGTALYNRKMQKWNNAIKVELKAYNPDISEEDLQNAADLLQESYLQEQAPVIEELSNMLKKEQDVDTLPEGIDAKKISDVARNVLKERFGVSDKEIDDWAKIVLPSIDARNQYNEVYQHFYDQLIEAGRKPYLADAESRLIAARATSAAISEGKKVSDIIDRFKLKFVSDNGDGQSTANIENKNVAEEEIPLATEEELKVLEKDIQEIKKGVSARAKTKGIRLSGFIKKQGGIKDDRGDIKAMNAPVGVLNKNGISIDDMAMRAWEAGYIQTPERPTINEFLNLLDNDLHGQYVYTAEDAQKEDNREYYRQLVHALDDAGADIDKDSLYEIDRKLKLYKKRLKDFEVKEEVYQPEEDLPFWQEAKELNDKISKLDAERLAFERKDINPELIGREEEVVNPVKITRYFAEKVASKDISAEEIKEKIKKTVAKNENDVFVLKNSITGENATLSNASISKMIDTTRRRDDSKNIGGILGKEAIANIGSIFDSAILIKTHDDRHGSKNKIRRYANVIKSGKESFIVKITVKEMANNRNELTEIEIEDNGGKDLSAYDLKVGRKNTAEGNSSVDKSTAIPNGTDININDLIDFVNTFTDDTIPINGVERKTRNSAEKRIAKTEEGLRAFYEWFGDSKVVDAKGRPLVVYHGTNETFSVFDARKIGYNGTADGAGFNFSTDKDFAERFTYYQDGVMAVYLKMENPVDARAKVNISKEQFKRIADRISNEFLENKQSKKSWEETVKILEGALNRSKNANFFDMFLADVEAYGNEKNEDANVYDDFRRIVKEETGIDGYVSNYRGHSVYVAFSPNQIKSVDNRGSFSKASDDIYYQIAGPRAKTAALDKLEQAKNLQKSGVDNEDIRQQTGWFLGADKKWRFEIPDGKLREDFDIEAHREYSRFSDDSYIITPLEDIYDNERLYEAYPELRQLPVQFSNALGEDTLGISFGGTISISSEYLNKDNPEYIKEKERLENTEEYKEYSAAFESEPINNDYEGWHRMTKEAQNKFFSSEVGKEYHDLMWGKDYKIKRKISGLSESAKSTLVHEIQHEIQEIEGFAKGGSTKSVVQEIKDIAERLHYKALGEFEEISDKANRLSDVLEVYRFSENPDKILKSHVLFEYGSPFSMPSKKDKKARKEYRDHLYDIWWQEMQSKYEDLHDWEFFDLIREGNKKEITKEYNRLRAKAKRLFNKADTKAMRAYEKLVREIDNGYVSSHDAYHRLYGEIEARNVQNRMDMSEEERLAKSPESTQDVSNADAIVMFSNGTVVAYETEKPKNESYYQPAYYGARVDHDKPSLEAIGTGEGAQVHGWGLYYALSKDVAEKYRKAFIRSDRETVFPDSREEVAINIYLKNNKDRQATIKELTQMEKNEQAKLGTPEEDIQTYVNVSQAVDYMRYIDDATLEQQIIEVENSEKGQVFEVDIPENPYLLDENIGFNYQSDFVKQAIKSMVEKEGLKWEVLKNLENNYTGEAIYKALSKELGSDKETSLLLNKYGIKGITYEGSQDGRCFVIFNDKDVKVIEKFYQPGFVSMKTELVGDYLDADRFEGTGEGNAAHGWGNYALQDRETNKINYYSWMSKKELFFGDEAIDFIGNNKYFAPYKAILVGINNNWGKDTIADAIKTQINHNKEEIERFEKELKTINVTEKEWEKWQELLAERDLLPLISNNPEDTLNKNKEIKKLLEGREHDFSKYDFIVEETGKLRETIRVAEEALERVENDFDKFKIMRTGAQYEVDVPENKFLLDLDKKFSKQSAYVKQKLADVVNDLPKTLDEKKLRTIAGDEIGSSSENWKTYYGKKMFFAGKERALELIHNDQEGDLERELTDFINNLKIEDITSLLEIENKTGREVYNDITNLLGTQKAASKFLEQHGIKGNRYDGQRDGIGFVIFNGKDMPVTKRWEQNTKNNPRGMFTRKADTGEAIITLFKTADASTVIHELGHFFLDDMRKFADNPETAEQLQAIYKYVGSKDGNLTIEQHEYFARSFEAYVMDGKAPNSLLKQVFDKFSRWLKSVYKTVLNLNVKLDDDIRQVFDQMLGGKRIDFAMQQAGANMQAKLERGFISNWNINKAMQLLHDGKMSKAEMKELIDNLKKNVLKPGDLVKLLDEYEKRNVKHNERLTEWDYEFFRNQLDNLNFKRDQIKDRILRLINWAKPRTQGAKLVGRFPDKKVNDAFAKFNELITMDKEMASQKLHENMEIIDKHIKGEIADIEQEGKTIEVEDLIFENKLLSFAAGKATNRMLLDIFDTLTETYNTGRLSAKITGEIKKARKERMVNDAIAVLTDNGRVNWREEKSDIRKAINRLGISQESWSGILDILSMNDKSSKTGESLLNQNLDIFAEEQKMHQGINEDAEKISEKMTKALKGTANSAISVDRYMNKDIHEKFEIEWIGNANPDRKGTPQNVLNKKTFTKDQLLDLYMKSKDDETKKIMLDDHIKMYNEEFLQKVDDILTEDDIAITEAIFSFYNENHEKINAFYEDHFGVSLPKNKYYSPRRIERQGVNVETGELRSYAGFSGVKQRTAKGGAVIARGAFNALQEYIVNSNHYMAFSDKLLDINAVAGNVQVKQIIDGLFGERMNKRLKYEISNIASNGKASKNMDAANIWNKVRARYAKAVLGLKPSLAIKQLTSLPAYLEKMSVTDFISGVADFVKNPKQAVQTLSNTTLMKTRDANIIRDLEELSKSDLLKNMQKAKGKIKWNDLLMLNIKLGDRGAIYVGGWAYYKSQLKKNLAKGMSAEDAQQKALQEFERFTDETQQSGRMSQQSYWQSNPMLRAFTMFTSSQNQYLRKELRAMRGLLTKRADKKQVAKTMFIYHLLLPMLFQWASDGFRWDKDAQLRVGVLGSLNGIFILNSILDNLFDMAVNGSNLYNSSMRIRDVLPFFAPIEDLIKDIANFDIDDLDAESVLDVIKDFGEVAGIPTKYPLDVAQNMGKYAEEDEYGKELLLWLGWSPYALRDLESE